MIAPLCKDCKFHKLVTNFGEERHKCIRANFNFANPYVVKSTFDLETGNISSLLPSIASDLYFLSNCEDLRRGECGEEGNWFIKKKFWHIYAFLRIEFFLTAFKFKKKYLKLCKDCRFYSNEHPFNSVCKKSEPNIKRSIVNSMPLVTEEGTCRSQRHISMSGYCDVSAIHFIPKKVTEQTTIDLLSK